MSRVLLGGTLLTVALIFSDASLGQDPAPPPLGTAPSGSIPAPEIQQPALPRSTVASEGAATSENVQPILGKIEQGKPLGFFYMQKYWVATRSLENACWYFTPDGRVYQNLTLGFSERDLQRHKGPKGRFEVQGKNLTITWEGQQPSTAELEFTETGFYWDTGSYLPIEAFAKQPVTGEFSGGTSMTFADTSSMVAKTLRLNENGNFEWSGAASIRTDVEAAESSGSRAQVGGSSEVTGRWVQDGFYLTLTTAGGETQRHVIFPFDDKTTPVCPDRLYLSGIMYKKSE